MSLGCVMTYSLKPAHFTLVVKKFIQVGNYKGNRKIWQEAKAEKRTMVSNTEQLAQKKVIGDS